MIISDASECFDERSGWVNAGLRHIVATSDVALRVTNIDQCD